MNQCIEWKGDTHETGYGIVWVNGRAIRVHRIVYTAKHGDIPEGFVVHHKCGNRLCININHLESMPDSLHKSISNNHYKNVTHCIHGHEFTVENTRTYLDAKKRVHRYCLICRRRKDEVRANLRKVAKLASNL